jgi:hypothetical protein
MQEFFLADSAAVCRTNPASKLNTLSNNNLRHPFTHQKTGLAVTPLWSKLFLGFVSKLSAEGR